jgi:hypothetical protein
LATHRAATLAELVLDDLLELLGFKGF